MKNKRPVNLAIHTMALPITAYASILHRICAVIIWFYSVALIPVIYYASRSQQQFDEVKSYFNDVFFIQFLVWGGLTALAYYCLASVKHFIQEFGYFEELSGGIAISRVTIGLALVLSIIAGGWVWLV